jgi:hypothetical protein
MPEIDRLARLEDDNRSLRQELTALQTQFSSFEKFRNSFMNWVKVGALLVAALGISQGWAWKLIKINKKSLDDFSQTFNTQVEQAKNKALSDIRGSATPLVEAVAKQQLLQLQKLASTGGPPPSTIVMNPKGANTTPGSISCSPGEYLVGLDVVWGGTCGEKCSADGSVLSSLAPICKPLFTADMGK